MAHLKMGGDTKKELNKVIIGAYDIPIKTVTATRGTSSLNRNPAKIRIDALRSQSNAIREARRHRFSKLCQDIEHTTEPSR